MRFKTFIQEVFDNHKDLWLHSDAMHLQHVFDKHFQKDVDLEWVYRPGDTYNTGDFHNILGFKRAHERDNPDDHHGNEMERAVNTGIVSNTHHLMRPVAQRLVPYRDMRKIFDQFEGQVNDNNIGRANDAIHKAAISKVTGFLSKHGINHEVSKDEEGTHTIYIPAGQFAPKPRMVNEAKSDLYKRVEDLRPKNHVHGGLWDVGKPAAAGGDDDYIGKHSHVRIYYSVYDTPILRREIKQTLKILKTHGIRHEVSRDEEGRPVIYIPKNQNKQITEDRFNDGGKTLRTIMKGPFYNNFVWGAPDHIENPIGGDLGQLSFIGVALPDRVHLMKKHLEKHGIKHELANNEADEPTFYFPWDQKEHVTETLEKPKLATTAMLIRLVGVGAGGQVGNFGNYDPPNRTHGEEPVGYGTHHRIWYARNKDLTDSHIARRDNEIKGLRNLMNKHNIQHEFSHDEEGFPTLYIPKVQ